EINFVTPGYFWRVRLLHIPTAQDMEFNLDNFHIENLTQDSASKCHAAVISATDYSPFGAPLPGRTYQASEYRFAFNGKEKDDETYGDGNAYDFGARIYDARLGKMFKVDPYFSVYPGLTPYSGFGGNPITNTDAGGKLIIFVSGYGPLRSSQSSLKYSRHWDVEMRQNAAATMDDYKAMYFTGSSKPFIGLKSLIKKEIKGDYDIEFTSAEMREDAGRAAVTYELAMIIKQQIDEQRITNPNAKINFVAHSMGVAYAAGMVKALLEAKDGEGNNIFSPSDFGESWLFAGYQSNRVDYPIVGTVNQRAHDNDKVAGNEEMRNYTTFQTKSWGNGELSTKAHGSETFLEYFEKTGTRLPETISKNGGTRKESSSKSNDKGGKGGDKTSRPPIRNVRNM
ncbi:MAG: RHS repeat-associated core domain-containing protein, partial [Bacteroidota bacterium]|nr:RHS repeat-associated core domain-containing protein [Bacteroidota bacterium]